MSRDRRRFEEYEFTTGERQVYSGESPPDKITLHLNLATDFRASTTGWETELPGENLFIRELPYEKYKYIWLPPTACDAYIHDKVSGILTPVIYKHFIPLAKKDLLILVRPDGATTGDYYFQYYLTDLKLCNVYDVYAQNQFNILAGATETIAIPFPTYQLKILFRPDVNPTSYDFRVIIYPWNNINITAFYNLDLVNALVGVGGVNNYYLYDWIGGSEDVTNPRHPFPSFRTAIHIVNNDQGDPITNCFLQVVSWEHTEWGQ